MNPSTHPPLGRRRHYLPKVARDDERMTKVKHAYRAPITVWHSNDNQSSTVCIYFFGFDSSLSFPLESFFALSALALSCLALSLSSFALRSFSFASSAFSSFLNSSLAPGGRYGLISATKSQMQMRTHQTRISKPRSANSDEPCSPDDLENRLATGYPYPHPSSGKLKQTINDPVEVPLG